MDCVAPLGKGYGHYLRAVPCRIWAQAGKPGAQPPKKAIKPLAPLEVVGKRLTGNEGTRVTLPAQVTEIDAKAIKRLNIRSVADLFRKVPGIQSHTFGQGDLGNPFILRGFSSDHGSKVGIYIDGEPQNLPSSSVGTNGMAEYDWLTRDMIKRITIIKGPASALYGDQALAGAVNIVTRDIARSSVEAHGGSFGTVNSAASTATATAMSIPLRWRRGFAPMAIVTAPISIAAIFSVK